MAAVSFALDNEQAPLARGYDHLPFPSAWVVVEVAKLSHQCRERKRQLTWAELVRPFWEVRRLPRTILWRSERC